METKSSTQTENDDQLTTPGSVAAPTPGTIDLEPYRRILAKTILGAAEVLIADEEDR